MTQQVINRWQWEGGRWDEVGKTCQDDVRERMGGAGLGWGVNSGPTPPGAGELTVCISKCSRFGTFDVSFPHATKK